MKMMRVLTLFCLAFTASSAAFHTVLHRNPHHHLELVPSVVRTAENQREVLAGGVPQQVQNYANIEYLANISVGTPPQTFTVVLDTSSANTWVVDKSCDNPMANCIGKHEFDSSASSTYSSVGTQWNITYLHTGQAGGVLGKDTVTLGDSGSLAVPAVTFGQGQWLSQYWTKKPYSGVIGLAFQSLAVRNVKPLFQEAIDQKLVSLPLFTVWLGDLASGRGLYTWGDVDTTNCGSIIGYQSLSSATFYQFQMKGVAMDTYSSMQKYEAISDSSASKIYGPSDVINQLLQITNAKYDSNYNRFMIDCKASFADLSFSIGSLALNISATNLVQPYKTTDNLCFLAVDSFDSTGFGPQWLLGTPFIRQFCNVYDMGNKRVGFAPSIAN